MQQGFDKVETISNPSGTPGCHKVVATLLQPCHQVVPILSQPWYFCMGINISSLVLTTLVNECEVCELSHPQFLQCMNCQVGV